MYEVQEVLKYTLGLHPLFPFFVIFRASKCKEWV